MTAIEIITGKPTGTAFDMRRGTVRRSSLLGQVTRGACHRSTLSRSPRPGAIGMLGVQPEHGREGDLRSEPPPTSGWTRGQ